MEGGDLLTTVTSGLTTESPASVTVVSVIKACLLGVTAVLILLGNSVCLVVLIRTRDGVGPVTKLFLISLTISDLLVGVLVGVPVVGSTAIQSWPYGNGYCTVVAMCHVLYFNAGLSVLAINIERYIAVIWPLRYPSIVTLTKAAIAEVVMLAILLLWGLLYILFPNRKAFYYNNFSVCFIDFVEGSDFMGQIGMTLFIAVPMLITVTLHVRLFLLATHHASRVSSITIGDIRVSSTASEDSESAVRTQNQRSLSTQRQESPSANSVPTSPETRAARTFFIMAVVAAVSWTPYYVTISWENFRSEPVHEALAFAAQILLLLNSIWNVIIYYTRNEAFRKTANRLLSGCCFRVRSWCEEELVI